MNNKYIFLIILIVLILIPLLVKIVFVDLKVFEANINVGGYLGFTIEDDKLYFGTVNSGGTARREIEVYNIKCNKCFVDIKTDGSLAKWISTSDNKFTISMGEKRLVNVTVSVPKSALDGNYNGTVKIYFWKTI